MKYHLPVVDITVFFELHRLRDAVSGKYLLDILLFVGPDGTLLVIDAVIATLAETALYAVEDVVVLGVGQIVEDTADAISHPYLLVRPVKGAALSSIFH